MSIATKWVERSKKYGGELEGVLPKSFPKSVNNALDLWMWSCVKSKIFKDRKVKILDLGCGYGRLSTKILENFSQTSTIGIDIAPHYVSLYNDKLNPRGRAFVGDIKKLPFKNNTFDLVIMVTTLMYLTTKTKQQKALFEILRVLKPGGQFVFIERNATAYKLVTLGGLIGKEIDSVSFYPKNLIFEIRRLGGEIQDLRGNPIWTLTLPINFFVGRFFPTVDTLLMRIIFKLDLFLSSLLTFSFYISYSGIKKK